MLIFSSMPVLTIVHGLCKGICISVFVNGCFQYFYCYMECTFHSCIVYGILPDKIGKQKIIHASCFHYSHKVFRLSMDIALFFVSLTIIQLSRIRISFPLYECLITRAQLSYPKYGLAKNIHAWIGQFFTTKVKKLILPEYNDLSYNNTGMITTITFLPSDRKTKSIP